ncbi:hypothetical protein GCM10009662_39170 [Catellatospora coxensis]
MIVRVLHRLVVIAAVVAATLLACAFMGTVHGLDPGGNHLQVPVILALSLVPMAVAILLGCDEGGRFLLAGVAWVVVFFAQVMMMLTVSAALLVERGEPVTATVTRELGRDGDRDQWGDYLYRIADPAGTPLAGVLRTPNQHDVGGEVEVLADPAGWAHPREAATIEPHTDVAMLIVLGVVFAGPGVLLYLLSCLPRHRPQDRSGEWYHDAADAVIRRVS